MSQKSGIKRSARVLEKEACANVSADDIVLPKDWRFIFFFEIDRTFSLVEVESKRWPADFKNSEKLSLSVGDEIIIKCGVSYDDPQSGSYRVQGHEIHLEKIMKEAYNLRRGGYDASKINCEELLEQLVSNEKPVQSQVDVESGSKKKFPKVRKDIEIPVQSTQNDEVADLPELDDQMVYALLNNAAEVHAPCGSGTQGHKTCMQRTDEVKCFLCL